MLVPLETFMDRFDPTHRLTQVSVKLNSTRDIKEISSMMLSRIRQAHHGIEDVEVVDLQDIGMRAWNRFLEEIRGWRIVLYSLAGTVLLVGGVGVLSVMLISFSDRRYEIGLRKSIGATDREIFIQFLLEAVVLAFLGAIAGSFAAAFLCQALSSSFPYGLVVNAMGLATAWFVALLLALVFGLYPAFRAMRLSPMEAMR
jgi:putative ABC transport system permease protein